MNQTLSLYRLQQTDSQISRVQARLQAIQKILEDDEALLQACAQTEIAEKNRLTVERALRHAENTVRDQHIKIEQTNPACTVAASTIPKNSRICRTMSPPSSAISPR